MIRLVLVILFALTVSANAQDYTVPARLPLETAVRREFREWMVTPARYPGLIPEQFYPIGWSRDGKFAYYYEPVDEACGCYFANLVIQDMRTDKVLWEFRYRGDDHADPATGDMPPEDTIAKLWKKNGKLFSEKLREHGIAASRSVLLPKTFVAAGRSYTAKGILKMGTNPDYGDERVNKFTFRLTSPKLGSKTIGAIDHSKEEYWYTLDAAILGVIKSPFEPRVAVIGMEVNRGWEGPPHNGDIRVVGASLNGGFYDGGANTNNPRYPPIWFEPINDPNKPDWEILPQEAKAGEVILSKRNELGILSNFAATPFVLDGKQYASVEGFWQMMLYPEGTSDERDSKAVVWKYTRDQVSQMTAFEAKAAGTLAEENLKILGIDWCTYNGKRFPYRSQAPGEHYRLIVAAMRAKLEQNPEVKRILLATGDLILKPDHHGEENPPPEWKYNELWMQLRSELKK